MTPLDGIDRLLIDGNNLLHRMSGNADPASVRLLLAKLSGAIPDSTPTIVMFDGHAASGTDRRQRIRRGLDVQAAGSITADEALLNIIRDTSARDRAGVVIVTDDRPLTEKARHLGARTKRLDWLEQLLAAPSVSQNTGIGRKGIKPPAEPQAEREPWSPGRGATKKKGNPKREKK